MGANRAIWEDGGGGAIGWGNGLLIRWRQFKLSDLNRSGRQNRLRLPIQQNAELTRHVCRGYRFKRSGLARQNGRLLEEWKGHKRLNKSPCCMVLFPVPPFLFQGRLCVAEACVVWLAGPIGPAEEGGQREPRLRERLQGAAVQGREEGQAQADHRNHRSVAHATHTRGHSGGRSGTAEVHDGVGLPFTCAEICWQCDSSFAFRMVCPLVPPIFPTAADSHPNLQTFYNHGAGEDLLVASADKPFRYPTNALPPILANVIQYLDNDTFPSSSTVFYLHLHQPISLQPQHLSSYASSTSRKDAPSRV